MCLRLLDWITIVHRDISLSDVNFLRLQRVKEWQFQLARSKTFIPQGELFWTVWSRSLVSGLEYKWESLPLPKSRGNASFFRATPNQTRGAQGRIVKWARVIFPADLVLSTCPPFPYIHRPLAYLGLPYQCYQHLPERPARWFSVHISRLPASALLSDFALF